MRPAFASSQVFFVATLAGARANCEKRSKSHGLATVAAFGLNADADFRVAQ